MVKPCLFQCAAALAVYFVGEQCSRGRGPEDSSVAKVIVKG